MPAEAPAIPEGVSEFAVLTEHDQKLLEESGRNLIEKFLQDYPDKLPDAIVFPDITARPLFYLLRPVLEKISKERKTAMPRAYFFATDRPEELIGVRRVEALPQGFRKRLSESGLTTYPEAKKKVGSLRSIWRARAEEINRDLARRGVSDPKIVIFDDFIVNAQTSGEISRAFAREVPLYVFLALAPQETLRKSGFPVTVGKTEYGHEEFDYSTYAGHKGIPIGVKKNYVQPGQYVRPDITASNLAEVRALREDMTKIGQKIAEELE